MIKAFPLFLFFFSLTLSAQVVTLTTTSKSAVWTPNKVVKTGAPITWKASATGMTDQIITTIGLPTFDLSVARTSDVTIIASISDNVNTLTELGLNSLNITSLNVINTTDLTSLSCTDNQLTSLDISNNSLLTELFCHTNQLTDLDLTNNKQLSILACFSNQISILDLSQNTLLTTLSCSFNIIKSLDLSLNISLLSLECDNNLLEDLNVQNSNNLNINIFNSTQNINLTCIQVDDETADFSKWNIDSWTVLSNDCTFSNRPPVAMDDQYETNDNTTLNIDVINGVLANDVDFENKPLNAILESNVSNGTLNLNIDGSFTYAPNSNFFGIDQFTYKANDGELDSNIATVIIDVILVNEPPISNDNSYETNENTLLIINENEGVLSNDSDPDGDIITAILVNDVNNGVLNLDINGAFSYTPDTDYYGTDFFVYQAFDGIAYSNESTVKIDVIPKYDIIVPNAFTPNNDNINDFFKPSYKGMNKVLLAVFDTWNNLIFYEESDQLIGWDGTVKGKNAENGNYLYKISAYPIEGEKIELNGLFTLIK